MSWVKQSPARVMLWPVPSGLVPGPSTSATTQRGSIQFWIWLGHRTYFEAALLIAMLGFVSTVAVCKYLLRGDIIE